MELHASARGVLMENDFQYYRRRVAEELHAASRASDPETQIRHRALAEQYATIVQEQENMPAAADGATPAE